MEISRTVQIINAFEDPVILIDQQRVIIAANPTAVEFFGKDLEGRDLTRAFRQPAALQYVDGVLAGTKSPIEPKGTGGIDFQVRKDITTDFRLTAKPIFAEGSSVRHYLIILKDISHIHEAEQMRSDFVANVSHELRSPLTAISGFIETLAGPAKNDSAAQARFLEIMSGEAMRMNRIIDDLLSLTRVELHARVRPTAIADLKAIVQKVANTLEQQASARDKSIRVTEVDFSCKVNADEDQLVQVVQNLLENAIKYSRAGTEISISLEKHDFVAGMKGAAVAFCISDRGDGIAPEHIPRLTERFYRIDSGRSRAAGGTGLGLAIVKHIVNRHRGKFTIESKLGTGSDFRVYLPALQ